MKKSLIIKLAIVLVVILLSYCVFWFFKAGQAEKNINKFITENSTNISAGSIAVSGFPVSQKIVVEDLKVTVPLSALAKRQIHFKKLEAHAGILSSDFTVNLIDAVKIQDLSGSGEVFDVEFPSQPEIKLSIQDGVISKLSYSDMGFKIFDANKNLINSSANSNFSSETVFDAMANKKTSKINVAIRELEGYSVFDFYKNVIDKKVLEGIKTEEIKVNNLVVDSAPLANPQNNAANPALDGAIAANAAPVNAPEAGQLAIDPTQVNSAINAAQPVAPEVRAAVPVENVNNVAAPAPSQPNPAQAPVAASPAQVAVNNSPNPSAPTDSNNPANPSGTPVSGENLPTSVPSSPSPSSVNVSDAISDTAIVKSNLVIAFTLETVATAKTELPSEPSDPTQVQELPVQYVQNIKIENFEFSNPLYKITLLGDVKVSSDDNYPSGSVAIKVEKIQNLVQQLQSQFRKYGESKKSPPAGPEVNPEAAAKYVPNYDFFLERIAIRLPAVSFEVGAKNSVTKDEIAQFDIRREKNLEFLVNETPVREIIGKF